MRIELKNRRLYIDGKESIDVRNVEIKIPLYPDHPSISYEQLGEDGNSIFYMDYTADFDLVFIAPPVMSKNLLYKIREEG